MKKKTVIMIIMLLMFISMTMPVHSEIQITVKIDGAELSFPDARPFIEEGRTLVPIRAIAEALGSEVAWNPDTKIVGFQKGSDIILLQIGSRSVTINGARHTIDVPAKISESRTYVPLRFVSEALGANVEWVGETRTILITTGEQVVVTPPPASDIPMIGSIIDYDHYVDRYVKYTESGLNLEKHSVILELAKKNNTVDKLKVGYVNGMPFALGRTGRISTGEAVFEIQGKHNNVKLVKNGVTVASLQYIVTDDNRAYAIEKDKANLLWESQYLMWDVVRGGGDSTFYLFDNPFYNNPF